MDNELTEDALVAKLVGDPSQRQAVMLLAGLLGRGLQEGHWRLYLTPRLDEYIELRTEDIVHHEKLTPEQSPLGGTLVWVKAEAKLQHVRTTTAQEQSAFMMRGDIMQSNIAQTLLEGQPAMNLAQVRFGNRAPLFSLGRDCPFLTYYFPCSFIICLNP